MGNQIKTVILLTVMTVLIMWIGLLIGGRSGMVIALFLAAGMNFFSYWYSDKLVLKMYRAQEISMQQAPEIFSIVKDLAQRAGLPMPKVYLIPQETPNAFATGRNPEHAVVAVTEGLVRIMNREEIAGVLAHELAHVKNRDILIGSIAATMAGAIMMIASIARWAAIFGGARGGDDSEGGLSGFGMIIMSIIAPIAAIIIQSAISRSREYLADSEGGRFVGNNEGLASALEKLGVYSKRLPMDANPSTAHMFIVNPLAGKNLMSLFSTHPPLEDRIAKLRGVRPPERKTGSSKGLGGDKGREFWDRLSE
ncbi:MAG: zinc metalloprotease HtpX [Desulfobacteraceae bacterium]|nr:zinc metalloprotease HtpX [Desulfobacteraceae bacterium]